MLPQQVKKFILLVITVAVHQVSSRSKDFFSVGVKLVSVLGHSVL